jgi:TPR repeat protein
VCRYAAQNGSVKALNNLGVLHETGEGVDKNLNVAEELYTKAAERGDVAAMLNLACLHLEVCALPIERPLLSH